MPCNVKEDGNMENTVNETIYKIQIINLKSYTVINGIVTIWIGNRD